MPRKQPPRDPNLDHPAVKLYIDICHCTPNHIQREAIIATVEQLDLYEVVLRQFMMEGRPPQKVHWTLERYGNQLPKQIAPSKSGTGEAAPISPEEEAWMRSRTRL